ncbi:MAG TPA: energy transducer TonB [Allosphingosinicella sp.]|nr:energy transducer TonB [Allosphingosinicella sp.]
MPLLLLAALLLSPIKTPVPPPTTPPSSQAGLPGPPPPGWPDPLPPHVKLDVLQQPDWTDFNIYPQAAQALDQQGNVRAEILIGRDGVPRLCRIAISSGYAELDEGTCQLLMQMRFAPPRDGSGRPVETLFRRTFRWMLNDQSAFAPARMTARLTLSHGAVTDCAIDREGAVPEHWAKIACGIFKSDADYYLHDRNGRTARATILVDLRPDGAAPAAAVTASGRLVATRQTLFDVDSEGDPKNCRTGRDEGFGPNVPTDHQTPCGFFLIGSWFESADPQTVRHGSFEVRVYVEEAK